MSPAASWALIGLLAIACYALAFVPYWRAHRNRGGSR